MTIGDVTRAMIDALNAAGVPYLLVGSFSSSYYGIPRSTRDADFVIELGSGVPTYMLRSSHSSALSAASWLGSHFCAGRYTVDAPRYQK